MTDETIWADGEDHPWKAGLLMGLLMKHQVKVTPVIDASGVNYTPMLDLELPITHKDGSPVLVRILVMGEEPTEDGVAKPGQPGGASA